MHREVADTEADELVVTDTMRERKQVMEDRADAFIALPGGIGTLEEFFEAWTAGYLGMHYEADRDARPVRALRGVAGLAARAGRHADTSPRTRCGVSIVVDDVDTALAACAPLD